MAGPRPLRIAPLLLLAGCAQLNYVVEVTVKEEVTTVVELSWATQDPGISWVEYGVASRFEHSTPSTHDESLAHVHTLLGLPPYQEVLYRAVTLVDGEELIVDGSVSTGGLPPELPELRVSAHQPELASPGPYLMGTMLGYAGGIFTIDREGRWLWYRLSPEATDPVEIAMDRSGPGFIYNRFEVDHQEDGGVLRHISFDGQVEEELTTPMAHHAFAQLDDGSLAWLTIDVRSWWDEDLGQEVDVAGDAVVLQTPGGEQRTIFSTWDWVEPEKHGLWLDAFYPQGADWTHGNGLHYDDERDVLLLSLRNLNTVLELALDKRKDQALPLRQFGLEGEARFVDSDGLYEIAMGEETFHMQHDPTFTADGTLLLTNIAEARTQVSEYRLDEPTLTMDEIRRYGQEENLAGAVMGMARDLPNGNWLLSFGTSGLVQEVTPAGELAWELRAPAGCALGDVLLFDDFYSP